MADDATTTEAMDGVESVPAGVETSLNADQQSADGNEPITDTAIEMTSKDDESTAVVTEAGDAAVASGDASESGGGITNITVLVKTPQDKKNISINSLASIAELREVTAKEFNVSAEQLCFIFTGKILQDDEQLVVSGIEDGSTIHLIIRAAVSHSQTEAKTSQSTTSADQTSAASASNTPSYEILDFAAVGLDKLNYSQLQQHMQRQLISNPEMIRQMMQNPLVQQLMSKPGVISELMSSNPQSKEWLQRNPELAEMLNSEEVMHQTLEISKNPEMLNDLIAAQSKGRLQFGASVIPTPSGTLKFGAAATLPELQAIWQQLAQKPQVLQQMLNMPYMKALLESLGANPQLTHQMIGSHPIFSENPVLQQQLQHMMPQYIEQLRNPAVQSLITNPKALQAMMKIQQGMDMLHAEAPGLVSSIGLPHLSVPPPLSTFIPPAPVNPVSNAVNTDAMANVMSHMIQQMATGQINQPIEERFKDQLEQLSAMGFTDQQANLKVLLGTFGDLGAAVEQLHQQHQ